MPALLRIGGTAAALLSLTACDVRVSDKGVSMGVFSGRASETWTRSYPVAAGGRIEIFNTNGPITVSAASGSSVEVKVEREFRHASDEAAREALGESPIEETTDAQSVKIEIRRAAAAERGGGRRGQMTSTVTVSLPPGLDASFTTENGAIRLEQVDGRLDASTSNGGINADGLAGSLTAATVNGGLRIGMRSVSGPLDLTVVNGGIELLLPAAVKARLKATALNGSVSVDDRLKLITDGSPSEGPARRRVEGLLNGGGPLVSAQATNGSVRVSAAQDQTVR